MGDEVIGRDIDEYEVDDFLKKIIDDGGVILPIKMGVHSGISVWHSNIENRYFDSWDCGTVGFSYMTAEKIKQEYGVVNDETREKAKKLLDYELKDIDCLLRGEVYCCSLYDENGLQDCMGGFYCYDSLEDMASDMAENICDRQQFDEIMKKIEDDDYIDL